MAAPAITTAAGTSAAAGAADHGFVAKTSQRLLPKGHEHTWGGGCVCVCVCGGGDWHTAGFINVNFHRDRSNGAVATSWSS